jgi:hypothetical protein
MAPPNATWQSIIMQAQVNPEVLKQQETIKSLQNVLQVRARSLPACLRGTAHGVQQAPCLLQAPWVVQLFSDQRAQPAMQPTLMQPTPRHPPPPTRCPQTNVSVCSSLGHGYLSQMTIITDSMLNLYKGYSDMIGQAISTVGFFWGGGAGMNKRGGLQRHDLCCSAWLAVPPSHSGSAAGMGEATGSAGRLMPLPHPCQQCCQCAEGAGLAVSTACPLQTCLGGFDGTLHFSSRPHRRLTSVLPGVLRVLRRADPTRRARAWSSTCARSRR